MDQERLQEVFHAQLRRLQTDLGIDVVPANGLAGRAFTARFGTLSIESAVADLCQCVLNNPEKRDKRLRRISMLVDTYQEFGYQFTADILEAIDMVSCLPLQETEEKSAVEQIEMLQRETAHENVADQNGVIYFEIAEEWVPPIAKHFHSVCTKAINKDGDVYDIMLKVGIIAFARLLASKQVEDTNPCVVQLLSGAQLIFKGGAAIGKFLFEQTSFWNRLSTDQQNKIRSSFIFGGDNDTSLYFLNMKEVELQYGGNAVSEAVVEIASCLQQVIWDTCQEFHIDRMLTIHSQFAVQDTILFAECEFKVNNRKAAGFRLTELIEVDDHEVDEQPSWLCLTPYENHKPSQVFTTQSKVKFSVGDKVVKFELVRAKLGFCATCDDISVNTYSELLDISLEYPESAVLFPKKWKTIVL